jgi:hypothetical protein
MPRGSGHLAGAGVLAVALAALSGCASRRAPEPSALASAGVGVEIDPSGPWHLTSSETPAEVAARTAPAAASAPGEGSPAAPPAKVATVAKAPARPAPSVPVPAARGLGQTTPKGAPPVKSVEATARERFLDHPTEVRGESLTLVLPARLAAEARLTGGAVEEPAPGRRVASGGARLTCRELTLVGERITLRTREPGSEDVQITARGGVAFVSRHGEQVVREEGLKTLIVTNDRVTPLR